MKTKALRDVQIKDATQGTVTAVFATLGVKDHDGDVIVKGAIPDGAEVLISAYGHQSWKGALPVGKGVIREDGNDAIFEGQFWLETTGGSDTFAVVKNAGDLQEWSFSLDNVEQERGDYEGGTANFIKSVEIAEVSPVIRGAGINTRTLSTKAKQLHSDLWENLRQAGRERWASDDSYVFVDDFDVDELWAVFVISPDDDPLRLLKVDFTRTDDGGVQLAEETTEVERTTAYTPAKGYRFSEQIDAVVADVEQLVARATEVVALRAEKGKTLSDDATGRLATLAEQTKQLEALLTPATNPNDEAANEYARFVALTQGV